MRKILLALVPGLILVTLGLAQTTRPDDDDRDKTAVVKRGDISTSIEVEGYFEPAESFEVRLRPQQYQGELKIVSVVEPGATVKKGDKLLELDQTEITKQLTAAENDLASAQANYTKAQADVQIGEAGDALAMKMKQTDLSNAESALKWWEEVDGAHLLKTAELAVKASKDSVEDQNDELDQLKKMYKSEELTNATADIVVKRALRAVDRAKIYQGMQEAKETKVKAFDYTVARQKMVFAIEQQKQELAELAAKQQQEGATRKTALASATQSLEKAQTRVDELREDRELLTITAPFDGTLYAGEFHVGSWQNANVKNLRVDEKLAAGEVAMTLIPAQGCRLALEAQESHLRYLKPGIAVRARPLRAVDETCEGTCGQVAIVPVTRDRSQFFPVRIDLTKVDSSAAPGQRAAGRIHVDAKDVIVVPASAVSNGRVKLDTGEWRDVVVGCTNGDVVEVRSGLSENETVFTQPARK